MARRLAVQLAEALELLERQRIAGQVQQRVQQHRAVAVGQHEAIAVRPDRIGGIVLQMPAPQHLGNLGHAHRHAGVAAVGRFHRIDREKAQRIGQLAASARSHRCVHRLVRSWRASWLLSCARRFRSIRRRIIGVKMNCIARPILPPGTTMLLGRLIHESCSIDSRYGKSMPLGLAKRITTIDSSAVGMSLAMNGLLVSTVGTRWKFTCVRLNCGQM